MVDRPRSVAELTFTRVGEGGDPLLLVHGGWEDRTAWDPLLPLLGTGFEVVACDRRGHGPAGTGEPAGTVRSDAEELAALIEGVDLYPAHIAAHGSASAAVTRLALERPELVRSVALHEPPFLALLADSEEDGPTVAGLTGAVHEGQRRARGNDVVGAAAAYLAVFAAVDETWESLPGPAQDRWRSNGRAWAQEADDPELWSPPAEATGELGVPVLVTFGEASPPFAGRIAQRLAASLPNATLAGLPGAGHLPHIFASSTLTGVWARFLLERNVPPT